MPALPAKIRSLLRVRNFVASVSPFGSKPPRCGGAAVGSSAVVLPCVLRYAELVARGPSLGLVRDLFFLAHRIPRTTCAGLTRRSGLELSVDA